LGRAPRLLLARRQVGLGSRLGLALGLGLGSPGLGLGSRLGLARELGSSGLGLGSWLGLDLALGRAFAGTSQPVAEYLHEMTVFPNGKHDDQVDSTAQFLDWFKRPFPSQGIFELMRMEAERARNRERDQNSERFRVRLRAPPGIAGSVQTFSRRHIDLSPDGTVEMSADDAQYFIRDGWTKLIEWTDDEAA